MSFGDEDEDINCTLWVGNLDPRTTESALTEVFIQAGPIERIHIPRGKDGNGHKGYCFIRFKKCESVPFAMSTMDGTILCGRSLKLEPRPGSKHKKADIVKGNLRQGGLTSNIVQQNQNIQQMPVQIPPQQNTHPFPPQQWFVTMPQPQMQLAQLQNTIAYPSCSPQLFQTYQPAFPNLNSSISSGGLIQFPMPHGVQLIPITIPPNQIPYSSPHQPQQQSTHSNIQQYSMGPWPSPNFQNSRPQKSAVNGYRQSTGNIAQVPSQHSESLVLNGSQFQTPYYVNRGGLRAQFQRSHHNQPSALPRSSNNQNNLINGNYPNPNVRTPFSQRSPGPAPNAFHTSPSPQQAVYTPTRYHHQSPPPQVLGAPLQQFYHQRPAFPVTHPY